MDFWDDFVKNSDFFSNIKTMFANRFWFFNYNSKTDKDFLKIQKMADQVLEDPYV